MSDLIKVKQQGEARCGVKRAAKAPATKTCSIKKPLPYPRTCEKTPTPTWATTISM